MGKNKQLELPAPPTQQFNSNLKPNIDTGSSISNQALRGDFSGDLSWLNPTINNNNSAEALKYAQGILEPQFRDTLLKIRNEAASNGQLESSTFTDALARSQSDLNSQYQSIVSGQAINDSNQSNANRLNIFGTGLQGLRDFTSLAQGQTNAENQFNLDNYDNLVAQAVQNNKNANRANAFQQVLGFSPIGHDYLVSQGINSVPGYGVADTAKIAGSFFGMGGLGSGSPGSAGSLSQQTQGFGGGLSPYTVPSNQYLNSGLSFSSKPYIYN